MNSHMNGEMNASDRKSVWKMNYKMKNDLKEKNEKDNIVVSELMPSVKEIVVANMWSHRKGQIEDLCTQIDKFEESHHEINDELKQLKGHNDLLNDNMPEMDNQIDLLKTKLEEVDYAELNADQIMNEIFTPMTPLDEKILHYQSKDEAF